MVLTQNEKAVVIRALKAYDAVRHKDTKGVFRGQTAVQILEELHPTPVRWAELASFVITQANGDPEGS